VETYCNLTSSSCVVGCTSDSQCSVGRICDSNARACHDGCRQDNQCGTGQICQNDACVVGCRSDGQCTGAGQICQNTACIVGCRTDSACGSGRICDNLMCRAGCRNDTQCGSGGVCQMNTLTCKTGCDEDSQCPKEQLCNTAALECAPGCHNDTGCNAGRICASGQCRDGCRHDTDCPLDNYCDDGADGGFTCKTGCGLPTTSLQGGNTSRCNAGEACVPSGDCEQVFDAWCTHACQKSCYGWTCATSAATPYTCFSPGGMPDYTSLCRETCTSDSSCGSGQICNYYTTDSQVPDDGLVRLCSTRCTSDADCGDTVDPDDFNNPPCSCGTDGLCHEQGGSYFCYHTTSTVLLP
jgi:hypothetical protein